MGFELAFEVAQRGGIVSLICGPTSEKIQHPNINRIDIISAKQMFNKCIELFPHNDITIMSAAVADFTPKNVSDSKNL